jgi:hypothetical protein
LEFNMCNHENRADPAGGQEAEDVFETPDWLKWAFHNQGKGWNLDPWNTAIILNSWREVRERCGEEYADKLRARGADQGRGFKYHPRRQEASDRRSNWDAVVAAMIVADDPAELEEYADQVEAWRRMLVFPPKADESDSREDDDEGEEPQRPELTATPASEIEPEPIRWLWPNRIAEGKLTIVAGFPDAGKSQITINMAATVSNGGEWPNGEGRSERGATLYLSAEDDASDTIVPRLKAAGADLDQVLVLSSIVRLPGRSRVFNLADDLTRLGHLIKDQRTKGRNVRLVIVDPISAYMGGRNKGDTFKNTDVRAMLTPLTEWASMFNVAVVAISHFNKGGNANALYKVTDSLAFTAAARTVWLTGEQDGQKMMLKGKHNIGSDPGGLAYSIEGVDIGGGINAPRIVWGDVVTLSADEVLNARKERGSNSTEDATEWLENYLSDGPRAADEVQAAARAAGHSRYALLQAKQRLGVKSVKDGFDSDWRWVLPLEENFYDDQA